MASFQSLTIDINVRIPRETLVKCVNIINMADRPGGDGELVTVIDEGKCLGYYVVDQAHSSESRLSLLKVANFPYEVEG